MAERLLALKVCLSLLMLVSSLLPLEPSFVYPPAFT